MEETIEGYVDHIIFRNQDNGYTVMVVVTEDEELTCVGSFQYMNEGETIKAFGHYTEHPSYGRQFVMNSYEVIVPQDSQAMERYLASGAVKGIGAALAARIVRRFKEDSGKIRYAKSNDVSSAVWNFSGTRRKNLQAVWSADVSCFKRKSISDGRRCRGDRI